MVLIINKCGQHSKFGLHRKFSFFKMILNAEWNIFLWGRGRLRGCVCATWRWWMVSWKHQHPLTWNRASVGSWTREGVNLPVVHNVLMVLQGIHVWGMWRPIRNITTFILQEPQTHCSHTWPSTVEHQVWGQLDQHMVWQWLWGANPTTNAIYLSSKGNACSDTSLAKLVLELTILRVIDHFKFLGCWWAASHWFTFFSHSVANQPPPILIKTTSLIINSL